MKRGLLNGGNSEFPEVCDHYSNKKPCAHASNNFTHPAGFARVGQELFGTGATEAYHGWSS